MGYVRKVCFFLEEPLSWDAAALRNAVAASKLLGAGAYSFPNFIRSEFAIRILARDSRDSSFAQLCYISFLFALRVPSEALLLRRAFRRGDLTHFPPMKDDSLIALRRKPSNTKLAIRLDRRKIFLRAVSCQDPFLRHRRNQSCPSVSGARHLACNSFSNQAGGDSSPHLLRNKRQRDDQSRPIKALDSTCQ